MANENYRRRKSPHTKYKYVDTKTRPLEVSEGDEYPKSVGVRGLDEHDMPPRPDLPSDKVLDDKKAEKKRKASKLSEKLRKSKGSKSSAEQEADRVRKFSSFK